MTTSQLKKSNNDLEFLVEEMIKLTGEILVIRDDLAENQKILKKFKYDDIPELHNKLDRLLKLMGE